MQKLVSLLMLSAVCFTASAQTESIFGFELGKPLALADCPFRLSPISQTKSYEVTTPTTCIKDAHTLNGYGQEVRKIKFSESDKPLIVKYGRAYPLEANGVLIGLHFLTQGLDLQDVALDQPTQKYGKPTTIKKAIVQNAMGATFESINASWRLKGVNVTFDGLAGQVDYGEVYIDLPQATELRSSWYKKSAFQPKKALTTRD
jgi:hypothetical protein